MIEPHEHIGQLSHQSQVLASMLARLFAACEAFTISFRFSDYYSNIIANFCAPDSCALCLNNIRTSQRSQPKPEIVEIRAFVQLPNRRPRAWLHCNWYLERYCMLEIIQTHSGVMFELSETIGFRVSHREGKISTYGQYGIPCNTEVTADSRHELRSANWLNRFNGHQSLMDCTAPPRTSNFCWKLVFGWNLLFAAPASQHDILTKPSHKKSPKVPEQCLRLMWPWNPSFELG